MSTASASDDPKCVVRYAKQLTKTSRRLSPKHEHPCVYLVPRQRLTVFEKVTFSGYSCLVRSAMPSQNKVIMVFGATGSGKSTLINMMINHILGVKWEDNFRFKLVDEHGTGAQSQAHSQTQNISSYTIHSNDHINVPYTLTIVDTPGFGHTGGIDYDKAIVEQIREFFSHPLAHGVDHIDAVGFVVQSSQARLTPTETYVFESILSVFGKDIEPNIMLMITFCDGHSPPVLATVSKAKLPFGKAFKFNNSALFASRGDGGVSFDELFWQMGEKSMNEFFNALDDLEPKSLVLTREVLKERRCLEIVRQGLLYQIQIACEWRKSLSQLKEILEGHEMDIKANRSFEITDEVLKHDKVQRPGKGSTNCTKCLHTCHHPCTFSRFKYWCHAMTWSGNCSVCPGKCSSKNHVHEYFTYRWITVKEKRTYAEIQNRYCDAEGRKPTPGSLIKKVEADLANADAAVDESIRESHRCTKRLDEIALKPKPTGVLEYLDVLIETENVTKNTGWETRVGVLKATKERRIKYEKEITDAAASGGALSTMWTKMVKQSGLLWT